MRAVLAVLMCGVSPVWAAAQTAPVTLPDNDTIMTIGWAGSEDQFHDQRVWHGSLLVAVSGGHYWTDHLKTEVEASWNSPHNGALYENIEHQGGITYALSDYRAQDIRIGAGQLYQFGRNEWVHPYVGAGADVVRRERTIARREQTRSVYLQNRNVAVVIPAALERETEVFVEPFLKTGLKMYVSEKAFVNTELKLGLRRDVDHVVWKFGVGVDF
jgi:opacity protein-like surface antigen